MAQHVAVCQKYHENNKHLRFSVMVETWMQCNRDSSSSGSPNWDGNVNEDKNQFYVWTERMNVCLCVCTIHIFYHRRGTKILCFLRFFFLFISLKRINESSHIHHCHEINKFYFLRKRSFLYSFGISNGERSWLHLFFFFSSFIFRMIFFPFHRDIGDNGYG